MLAAGRQEWLKCALVVASLLQISSSPDRVMVWIMWIVDSWDITSTYNEVCFIQSPPHSPPADTYHTYLYHPSVFIPLRRSVDICHRPPPSTVASTLQPHVEPEQAAINRPHHHDCAITPLCSLTSVITTSSPFNQTATHRPPPIDNSYASQEEGQAVRPRSRSCR
jgi:hypothetical protein